MSDEEDVPRDPEEDEGEDLLDEDAIAKDYEAKPELDRYDTSELDETAYDAIGDDVRREAERQLRKRDLETARRSGRVPAALLTPSSSEHEDQPARRRRRINIGDDDLSSRGDEAPSSRGDQDAASMGSERDRDRDRDRELSSAIGEPQSEGGALSSQAGGEALSTGGLGPPTEGEGSYIHINLDEIKPNQLSEQLQLDAVRKEIRRRFAQFIRNFHEDGKPEQMKVYPARLSEMCSNNKQSLDVNYVHLSLHTPVLAMWLADEPSAMLELFDKEATDSAKSLFPEYEKVHSAVHVRVTHLPIIDNIRNLRQDHMNCLIKVVGVVTRRSQVYPQLDSVLYNCAKCGNTMGPFLQSGDAEVKPGRCNECQSTGPFSINSKETSFRNFQKVTLQEKPGTVPAGRVPRHKEVILLHDLIDSVAPGEEVHITGIYKHCYDMSLNFKNGYPVFSTQIIANHVSTASSILAQGLTDEDTRKIVKLSKLNNVSDIIARSIAPSIYGHDNIKMALALSLFGGEAKQFPNKHRIRGDINVLIMGDPGTAKSQFLKYAEKTSHRAVYTTGKGASAVGLTASVHTDPVTREWTLEGGALVLADQGVCLIDEFDKMNDQDRTSIHEAMEQQTISISKATILTSLKARCAVIAAANPIQGRYDSSQSFADNVDLSDAILSRFDILCVVRDTVDYESDRRLATFVVDSHSRAHPAYEGPANTASNTVGIDDDLAILELDDTTKISQDLLRKYIMYARQHCHPKLDSIDDDKIAKLYADLRRESMVSGGIPIAVRHVESIIRMSEAHAKLHLRASVIPEDVDLAIRVMLESFISTQKYSVMTSLRKHFNKYLSYKKDEVELLAYVLNNLVNEALHIRRSRMRQRGMDAHSEEPIEILVSDFEQRAQELNIRQLGPFYKSRRFHQENYTFIPSRKVISKRIA